MRKPAAFLCAVLLLAGCGDPSANSAGQTSEHRVKTRPVTSVTAPTIRLTGVIRARYETPQAFQVSGQIATREVDSGQRVAKGDVLFTLDPSDLRQSLTAAKAELASAKASAAVARADLERDRKLFQRDYLSRQAFDRAQLSAEQANTQEDAARARMEQAQNALEYATLRAESDGLLIEVSGEPGQVVQSGHPVARLARAGPREVEVAFPSDVRPPATGELLLDDERIALKRREVSGSVDAASRTWQARYRLAVGSSAEELADGIGLGEVVQTRFVTAMPDAGAPALYRVPVAAVDERGEGPRLWHIIDGKARAFAVKVTRVERDQALVSGSELRSGMRVIALGTHLLTPDMPVRALDAPRDDEE
ncbi:MAG: efflux RND transporter periplasmic adaptor subunit [Halomonas sp.]|nr:efflux RND transporter periplasmic adaptor subunit [Halomonas sp.]MDN6297423.1 efflux RND transporter periplasmic adaptor subunit [Halomonas sp.]MDN6314700.1 efflux RND transporter periplasmic adaptor subunit [Halomonas sp.]MDN6336315.1 efflux RND transporter periplasmic adaptor subunit [Halomonas sp.]